MSDKTTKKKSIFRRKRFWLALIYLSLLVGSGLFRYKTPQKPIPNTKKAIQLNSFDGNKKLPQEIHFAYKEIVPAIQNDKLPVVLIHGSPGSAEVFNGLSKIVEGRHLISVDLPGFGHSEMNVPDYSINAHAKYLQQFLEKKNIKKAHFAGFSLGGGVILHLAEMSPENVVSISFIASIGVQEYELLGSYHANHIIHGVQLGFVWSLQNLTPSFGVFDGIPYTYSRNFYDTDQRPLRRILENYDKPFQIIHGKDDPLVPVEAALEHKRIVPQSEYRELDDNHFFIFQSPEKVDGLLEKFWKNVESGKAKNRSNADKKRIAEAKKPFNYQVIPAKGATIFVFFLVLGFIAFFNEDLAFIIAGVFIFQGRFGFVFAITACLLSILLSIMFWLIFGKFNTGKMLHFDWFSSSKLYINRNFGFRFPIYFAVGKKEGGFWVYPLKLAFSAFFWTILLISASYLLASTFVWLSALSLQNTFGLISVVCIIYLGISFLVKKLII